MTTKPRLGYGMAAVAAAISGFSIYVNSLGVARVIKDATLYTTLKNAVVGLIVLLPVLFLSRRRSELSRLSARQWGWLAALAVIGGSVAYVLFFEGLKLTTATTGSVINHLQFAFVALLAVVFLRERLPLAAWGAVAVLFAASFIGVNLNAIRIGQGGLLVLSSTVLFAAGFVIAKHLLAGVSTEVVMAAKMTGGSLILVAYSAVTGHLRPVAHLTAAQWEWVLLTGLILLAFTASILVAIRHAPVTSVLAIGTASPLITLALQTAGGSSPKMPVAALISLALTVAAAVAIVVTGVLRKPGRVAG